MMPTVGRWCVMVCCAAACTVGDGSENASTFGMSTPGSFSSSASASGGSDTDDEDDGNSSGSSEGSTTEEEPDPPDTTSSSGAATGDPSLASADDTASGDQQPEEGMYSACLMATECVGQNTCMTINDKTGFCTTTGCADPLADCEPSPGGMATPLCYPAPSMPGQFLCALGCDGGLTCPPPMTCHEGLADGAVCS
jgi:hypothetical protein